MKKLFLPKRNTKRIIKKLSKNLYLVYETDIYQFKDYVLGIFYKDNSNYICYLFNGYRHADIRFPNEKDYIKYDRLLRIVVFPNDKYVYVRNVLQNIKDLIDYYKNDKKYSEFYLDTYNIVNDLMKKISQFKNILFPNYKIVDGYTAPDYIKKLVALF